MMHPLFTLEPIPVSDSSKPSALDGFAPPAVRIILAINVIAYMLTTQFQGYMYGHFGLWPLAGESQNVLSFKPWQLITYGFMHGSQAHLFFNMFGVWMFGSQLERLWGGRPFTFYYLVCIVGAGLIQLAIAGSSFTVGASGGLFGLLLGYALMYPNNKVFLIFFPVPIKAKHFVVIYGAIELYMGFTRPGSTIAHFAHLGGMFFGLAIIQYWRGRLPWKPKTRLIR